MLLTRHRAAAITSRVLNAKDVARDFPADCRVALIQFGESGIGHCAFFAGTQAPLVPKAVTAAQGLEMFSQHRRKKFTHQ
jgi:hypothetical protein